MKISNPTGYFERVRLLHFVLSVLLLVGLLPLALASFSPAGYTWRAVGSVLALGLVPLGLGHTLYNAALRRTNATLVNLVATQEVTAGIILGIIFLNEIPNLTTVVGVLVALAGIVLVIL